MNIFRWAVTVFFLLMMVTGGISAVFFGLAALFTVPIKKLTQFKKHIKIKPIISVILAVVLFFGGIALAPQPDTTVPAETEDTVSTDAETVNAPITDSLKYSVNSETESEIRAEPAIEPDAK